MSQKENDTDLVSWVIVASLAVLAALEISDA